MGAVNYATSDYITMGILPYSTDMDEQEAQEAYSADWENVEHIIDRYNLYYYHVTIKPGYYEGFALDIENNYPIAFASWEDRRECQKEITQIKKLLIECAGVGLVSCRPGWCTAYDDYSGTVSAISAAVKAMREEVRATPTWTQYNRVSA